MTKRGHVYAHIFTCSTILLATSVYVVLVFWGDFVLEWSYDLLAQQHAIVQPPTWSVPVQYCTYHQLLCLYIPFAKIIWYMYMVRTTVVYHRLMFQIYITHFSCCLHNFKFYRTHGTAQSTFGVFLNDQSVLPLTANFCWYHINAPGQVIISLSLSLSLSTSLSPSLSILSLSRACRIIKTFIYLHHVHFLYTHV